MIRFSCPSCGAAASAPIECVERTTTCRGCGKPITVPRAAPTPTPAPPTASGDKTTLGLLLSHTPTTMKPAGGAPKPRTGLKTTPPGRPRQTASGVKRRPKEPEREKQAKRNMGLTIFYIMGTLLFVFAGGGLVGFGVYRYLDSQRPKDDNHADVRAPLALGNPSEAPQPGATPSTQPTPSNQDSSSPKKDEAGNPPASADLPKSKPNEAPKPADAPKPKPDDTPKPKPDDNSNPKPDDNPKPKPDDIPKPKPDDSPKPKPDDNSKPDQRPKPDPLAPLLKDLKSNDKDVKAKAVVGLAKLLKDGDDVTRLQAAQALGEAGLAAKAVRHDLDDATNDSDVEVRREARKAVAAIDAAVAEEKKAQTRQKLVPLLKNLKDKSATVRQKALEQIADMGADGAEASEGLLAMLTDKSVADQRGALDALEKVNPALHKPVLTLLVDKDDNAKQAAIKRLGDMGAEGKPAVATLIRFYIWQAPYKVGTGGQRYGYVILTALKEIDPENKDYLDLLLTAAAVTPISFNARNREIFDSNIRVTAIRYILEAVKSGNMDGARAVKPLLSALDDKQCRVQAINALGALGAVAKDALPTLEKLKTDPVQTYRDAATEAVKKIE